MGRRSNSKKQRAGTKSPKPLIYVFYEGESEKQYLKQIKKHYYDSAVIKFPSKPELFQDAVRRFEKDASYRDSAEDTDEIWFFFDAHDVDGIAKDWEFIYKNIKKLRKLKKAPGIRVRLLMTTGCLEYWLMLHFKKYLPSIQTKEERERVEKDLKACCQKILEIEYEKGDPDAIREIYEFGLRNAIEYGAFYLQELEKIGLPRLKNPYEPDNKNLDERYKWLLENTHTFTTVQEGIVFLNNLEPIFNNL